MLPIWTTTAALAQLLATETLINDAAASPWLFTATPSGGNVTLALPNTAVQVAAAVAQTRTYDPMAFLQRCDTVVLCNRHIYACADAPIDCFIGDVQSTWYCPQKTSQSCWTIVNGKAETALPFSSAHAILFTGTSATVYTSPGSVMAAEHLALAFGMLGIAIAVQHNACNDALLCNWAIAITSVLVTTRTPARLGKYPHAAATAASAFTAVRLLFGKRNDGSVRALALIAALASVPTEKLGITPLMYAAFVVSICIAASAQAYHPLTLVLLTLWSSAGIDEAVSAAHLYADQSLDEVLLSVAITLSSAVAGVLGH